MVGWHRQLKGHEFEQAPGDSEGQGGLACCSPWGHRDSDTTEQLNNKISSFQERKTGKSLPRPASNTTPGAEAEITLLHLI